MASMLNRLGSAALECMDAETFELSMRWTHEHFSLDSS